MRAARRLLAFKQLLTLMLRAPALCDIVKDDDDTDNSAVRVLNRSAAVFNRNLSAVSGNQDRVIGKPDGRAFALDGRKRAFDRLACLFVDDLKNRFEPLIIGVCKPPARECFGGRVDEIDEAFDIRGNHGVADAGQRHAQPLALLTQGVFDASARTGKQHEAHEEHHAIENDDGGLERKGRARKVVEH
jgi:hypothetical protein